MRTVEVMLKIGVKGFELGMQSAADGSRIGQCSVGECYLSGLDVAQDGYEAVCFWRLAAAHGHEPSQNNLGKLFECL
jgi:TPR repeat protein